MRSASIVTLLAIAEFSVAAPAPLLQTIWQTATQVYNTDGSLYTLLHPQETPSPAPAPAPAATPAAAPAPAAPAPAAAAPAPTTTQRASGSSFNLDSLLNDGKIKEWLDWFGIGDSSPTTAPAAPATSAAPATTSTFNWFPPVASSKPWPTTSTASTASSDPQATGGIYDDIYKASDIDKTFAKQILDSHNSYRSQHGSSALSWDNAAYQYAKNNADNYDCSGILTHTHGQYGENLAAGFPDGPSAVKAWYVEGETYNYQSANTFDHFTQVVWKDSTKVGCAYKDCSSTNWQKYIICSYDPPGNVVGENKANVLPPN